MLVSGVEGRRLVQDFFHYPIVCSNRFNQVLSVSFVVDLEGGPSGGEFHFPAKLSVSTSNINFAVVTASLKRPCPKLHSFACVFDNVSFGNILKCLGGVDSAAILANGEVGKSFSVFLL